MSGRPRGAETPTSSLMQLEPDADDALARDVRGRWGRRVAVAALAAFALVGLLGGVGYRERTVRARTGDTEVVLVHPSVTRSGLPSSWSLTIHSVSGGPLGHEIAVETTDEYFGVFDHNDLVPAPDRAWQTSTSTRWEYDVTDEDELRITLDVRTQPDARWRRRAATTVWIDGVVVAQFDYRTLVFP